MDILEAYQKTLDAIEELKEAGIQVAINPSKEKDGPEAPLPRDKWIIVTFTIKDESQPKAILQKAKELNWAGITFDTSGCKHDRAWEVDWSFKVSDTPDGDREAMQSEVEEMLDDIDPTEQGGRN